MGKHTPGKWEIKTDNDGTYIVGGDRFYDIAKVVIESTDSASYYETIANARLIVSAPEMLEALKQMAYCASHQCGFGCNVEKCPKPLKIQALLARIEGGE